jgi:hypothetical protein
MSNELAFSAPETLKGDTGGGGLILRKSAGGGHDGGVGGDGGSGGGPLAAGGVGGASAAVGGGGGGVGGGPGRSGLGLDALAVRLREQGRGAMGPPRSGPVSSRVSFEVEPVAGTPAGAVGGGPAGAGSGAGAGMEDGSQSGIGSASTATLHAPSKKRFRQSFRVDRDDDSSRQGGSEFATFEIGKTFSLEASKRRAGSRWGDDKTGTPFGVGRYVFVVNLSVVV